VCFAGPSQAAGSADDAVASPNSESAPGAPIALNKYAKHSARHSKKYAHHKSGEVELKSSSSKKDAADVAAPDGNNSSAVPSSEIPAWVANANARLVSADTPSAHANNILQTASDLPAAGDSRVVSADQLNDVDRALHESSPPAVAPPVAMAPAVPAVSAAGNQSSIWDQTSLIGKIFIGFGALLTMASAARMFMA
jgi:hypothetical protein